MLANKRPSIEVGLAPRIAFASTSRKVRVVSYNIAGNHEDYSVREDGIVLTLLSADADIICLQEVWGQTLTPLEHIAYWLS